MIWQMTGLLMINNNVDIDGNAFGDLDMRGQPNFNGLNLHGDDIPIPLPLSLSGFGWVGGLPGDKYLI
ncbi:MAG: hypothetical protein CM15mP75_6030 [Flammeovirgaceae bacterium]|nr:MAG: hypothetical protein CM15mP75_6030 [Flammeovirgaceae bacterium]